MLAAAAGPYKQPDTLPSVVPLCTHTHTHCSTPDLHPQAGKLVGNLSVSDIRGLKASEFPLLLLSAGEFAMAVRGKGNTKADALAGKRVEVGYAYECDGVFRCCGLCVCVCVNCKFVRKGARAIGGVPCAWGCACYGGASQGQHQGQHH